MILKVTSKAVINKKNNPAKNTISAINSNRSTLILFRIEMNDKTQLVMNIIIAKAVSSSMIVSADLFPIFIEVNTIKQRPNKVAEVLRICGDVSFFLLLVSMCIIFFRRLFLSLLGSLFLIISP